MNIISGYSMRPSRSLYYKEVSKTDIDNYYNGILPDEIAQLDGRFGTYGTPCLFIINKDGLSLCAIGIEYRPDDDRIEYPVSLEKVDLSYTFFRSELMIEEVEDELNHERVMEHVDLFKKNKSQLHSFMDGKLSVKQNPEILQMFVSNGQCRVMIESEYIIEEKAESEKDSMYKEMFYTDGTTGYHNWNYIWPRMACYNQYGIQDYSLVYFDIKDFKAINVVYGHMNANVLLTKITRQMDQMDWIYCGARCDNDNFAMMIKDMPEEETLEKLEKFFEGVSYLEQDENYKVYYRCGVVPMRITVEMGNLAADAGKQAKAFGTNPFKTEIIFFTKEMREEQNRAIRLRTYLDTAIEKDEFLVYIQPKYDIITEKVKGGEALIRWKYKGKNMMSPGLFVPIFEAGGLISKLDDIVLNKVCAKIKEWEKQGKPLYPISVNVSRKSVGIPGLVDHLTEIVDSFGVDHSLIDFELTESAAYDNQDYMIKVLSQLREKGFKISMDDFGTGYSSLSLLPLMPFNTLKIDKSFVDRIGNSEDCIKNCAVVEHIVSLAKQLKLTCLAEGAEEKEQVDLLREFGCEYIQGYYYSKPIPMDEYEALL